MDCWAGVKCNVTVDVAPGIKWVHKDTSSVTPRCWTEFTAKFKHFKNCPGHGSLLIYILSPCLFLDILKYLCANEWAKTAGKRKENASPLKKTCSSSRQQNYPSPFRFENRVLFLPINPAEIPPNPKSLHFRLRNNQLIAWAHTGKV